MAISLLACGIDPGRSILFKQSHVGWRCGSFDPSEVLCLYSKNFFIQVKEHAELGWLLGCITPMNWLDKMTQFKSKEAQYKGSSSLGLYSYPVLQAADILLYKATGMKCNVDIVYEEEPHACIHSTVSGVPVGEDQVQHLELARKIAATFNSRFGDVFVPPQPILTPGRWSPSISMNIYPLSFFVILSI
jgi:tryptophanyl-tRNA synthetase